MQTATHSITITRPDDWHVHLRDNEFLAKTVADISRYFARAIVMPNLVPPVTDITAAKAYYDRIQHQHSSNFKPLMTLYLTDNTTPEMIKAAKASGLVFAVKLYPAGATTNSASGVTDINKLSTVFETLAEVGMPLLIHGEVTNSEIDIFDREKVFIDQVLSPLMARYPSLRIVLEHITTKDAVEFVKEASDNLAATITAHHLLFNRNHMLVGGIKPHFYCLPVLKRNIHQRALLQAACSGNAKFFIGTDSAPHVKSAKESACGCAGSYTAFAAIELYAQAFEQENALEHLEAFASFNGPDFYRLPRNTDTITLIKQPWQVPQTLSYGDSQLVPLMAGETINWQVLTEA
jgi:dihydroorotase